MANAKKRDCGFSGITQAGCEAKSCCWKEATPDTTGTHWCFHKGDGPQEVSEDVVSEEDAQTPKDAPEEA